MILLTLGTGLTITDLQTATIDASVESTTVAGATLNDTTFAGITASADNTNLTIKGGSYNDVIWSTLNRYWCFYHRI